MPNRSAIIFDDGTSPFDATTKRQLGRAVVAALLPKNFSVTANEYIFVHSFTLTQNQVLGYLQAATNTSWSIEYRKAAEQSVNGRTAFFEIMNSGKSPLEMPEFLPAVLNMIVAVYFGYPEEAHFGKKAKKWMEFLGLQAEDAETVVRNVCEM